MDSGASSHIANSLDMLTTLEDVSPINRLTYPFLRVFIGVEVIVLCYVDDLIVIASNQQIINSLKTALSLRLPANDFGDSIDFLDMKLIRKERGITLVQSKYTDSLIADFVFI